MTATILVSKCLDVNNLIDWLAGQCCQCWQSGSKPGFALWSPPMLPDQFTSLTESFWPTSSNVLADTVSPNHLILLDQFSKLAWENHSASIGALTSSQKPGSCLVCKSLGLTKFAQNALAGFFWDSSRIPENQWDSLGLLDIFKDILKWDFGWFWDILFRGQEAMIKPSTHSPSTCLEMFTEHLGFRTKSQIVRDSSHCNALRGGWVWRKISKNSDAT